MEDKSRSYGVIQNVWTFLQCFFIFCSSFMRRARSIHAFSLPYEDISQPLLNFHG